LTAPKLSITTPNGRYYAHPRKASQVPSITNIMKQKAKPALMYWATKQAAIYAAENHEKLGPLDVDERVRLIKGAPFERNDAAAIGDIVHDWIDRLIKGGTIPDAEVQSQVITARRMLDTFRAFCRKYNPQFLESEFTVWSDAYGYAGTGDWYGRIGDWLVLVDNKTGNRTYWETGMQLAAVAKADFIIDEMGNERELPTFDRAAILHIRPTQFQFIPVNNIDECFAGFVGLKASFDLEVNHGDSVLGYAPKIKTATVPE
jgi:hypothetical protein